MKRKNHQKLSIKIRWLIICALLFSFCVKNSEEYQPQLNVYCILRNDVPYQKVVVDRTYRMDEKAIYDLEDVQVILSGDGICDTLIEDYGGPGIFRTRDTFPVFAGKTYHLRVSAKGFDTLTGITTVPDSFYISYPRNGDTISGYCYLEIYRIQRGNWYYINFYYQDSILTLEQLIQVWNYSYYDIPGDYWVIDTGFYYARVSAVDTNFVEYYYLFSDSLPHCGVKNGLGLFGSFFTKSVRFYLRIPKD